MLLKAFLDYDIINWLYNLLGICVSWVKAMDSDPVTYCFVSSKTYRSYRWHPLVHPTKTVPILKKEAPTFKMSTLNPSSDLKWGRVQIETSFLCISTGFYYCFSI